MEKIWNYAELSRNAKAAGGPEQYLKMVEGKGRDAGKREMFFWIGVATVGASLLTAASMKIVEYLKSKNIVCHNQELELPKEELLNGMEEYNVTYEQSKEGGDEHE